MSNQSRVPAGVPTGGRFSPQGHDEADIDLSADAATRFRALLEEYQDDLPLHERLAIYDDWSRRWRNRPVNSGPEVEEEGARLVHSVASAVRKSGITSSDLNSALNRYDTWKQESDRFVADNGEMEYDLVVYGTDVMNDIVRTARSASSAADDPIVWADEDGEFPLGGPFAVGGGFGNPGCDTCGEDDAVVKAGSRYLCELHAGDNGLQRPSDDMSNDGSSGNPAYPNGRCSACGFGLGDEGECTNADCEHGILTEDQTPEVAESAANEITETINNLSFCSGVDKLAEIDSDFPVEDWHKALELLGRVGDYIERKW